MAAVYFVVIVPIKLLELPTCTSSYKDIPTVKERSQNFLSAHCRKYYEITDIAESYQIVYIAYPRPKEEHHKGIFKMCLAYYRNV